MKNVSMKRAQKSKAVVTLRIHQHFVTNERLLESRAHEIIARAGMREDSEVNPEERQVDNEGDQDKADSSRNEMPGEVFLENTVILGNVGILQHISLRLNDPS